MREPVDSSLAWLVYKMVNARQNHALTPGIPWIQRRESSEIYDEQDSLYEA